MSSSLTPTGARGAVAAPTDGDNRYKAVQHKLKTLGTAMEEATAELEALQRSMRAGADRAESLAVDIAGAGLDPKFVELTHQVAVALGGAATEARRLDESAREVSTLTSEARRTHARLYSALDDVRSGRPEKTPKPGFFA
ncbi:conjugal transfer protein TraB [Streptomyces mangrovi]|uniref:conjugal transfer protein TraB n=1 Tax=Streptomyces mangrovi TaxID=1206892 RepID=UPI00399D35A8